MARCVFWIGAFLMLLVYCPVAQANQLSPVSSSSRGSLFAKAPTVDTLPFISLNTARGGLNLSRLGRGIESPRAYDAKITALLDLIGAAEVGALGYDAVHYGARIRPAKPATQLTLGEVFDWIDATPGQNHAIGRYQFIPQTLRSVARTLGYGATTYFDAQIQDTFAVHLLREAGLRDFQDGTLERSQFMRNLAMIWAGLPLPNGRSYYHGYAGNRASVSWEAFSDGMARIWPSEY